MARIECSQPQRFAGWLAPNSGGPNMGPRNLTISASHWSLCPRTATCAREQITAARRMCSLPPNTPFGSAHTKVDGMQGSVTLRGAESKFGHGVELCV
ncbi:hypothetical protein HaLaN_32270 [Haematococcus lacustris]|uniref:Uncharacterized protein n=1 Tax=Haematococcus lacustris TaxID=44745 RepID=A0A6A0AKF9_HAELA|nr:hypothetical protein HaLaN_32270 [Haematococcus lacustris]